MTDEKYKKIINLPHHVSQTRPHMSMYDRAAQFSPFAALTGHEAALNETARLTDKQAVLSEDEQNEAIRITQKYNEILKNEFSKIKGENE